MAGDTHYFIIGLGLFIIPGQHEHILLLGHKIGEFF